MQSPWLVEHCRSRVSVPLIRGVAKRMISAMKMQPSTPTLKSQEYARHSMLEGAMVNEK